VIKAPAGVGARQRSIRNGHCSHHGCCIMHWCQVRSLVRYPSIGMCDKVLRFVSVLFQSSTSKLHPSVWCVGCQGIRGWC
jgi:hypothetical protein